jgi:hypothetical protein
MLKPIDGIYLSISFDRTRSQRESHAFVASTRAVQDLTRHVLAALIFRTERVAILAQPIFDTRCGLLVRQRHPTCVGVHHSQQQQFDFRELAREERHVSCASPRSSVNTRPRDRYSAAVAPDRTLGR